MFTVLDNITQMHLMQRIPLMWNTFHISEIRRSLATISEIDVQTKVVFVRFVIFVFEKEPQKLELHYSLYILK